MTGPDKREHVDALLRQLCAQMKAPPVKLDAQGRTALQGKLRGHTATITISLHDQDDVVMLQGPVGRVPLGETGEHVLLALMGLNLAVDQTAGTAFAWDPKSGVILVTHCLIGSAITNESFSAAFFRVFAVMVAWQGRLETLRAAAPVTLPTVK